MDFTGPAATDFANVACLNREFLGRLRDSSAGRDLRQHLPEAMAAIATGLTDLQIERLCRLPFLLLSLRERDEDFWRVMMHRERNFELFEQAPGTPADPLCAAALSFLWQLAGRNPYAARLISGATLAWCERLAECTLLDLLARTASRGDCILPRMPNHEPLWARLFGAGLSGNASLRHAAHMAALQIVLTEDPVAGYRPLRAAACRVAMPSTSVAETRDRR